MNEAPARGQPSVVFNGPVIAPQIGNNNDQHNTFQFAPRWPAITARERAELVASLRGLPPQNFSLIRGFDNYSAVVAEALVDDLTSSGVGWKQVASMGHEGVASKPSPEKALPTPAHAGVQIFITYSQSTTPQSVMNLANWCQHVGLSHSPFLAASVVPANIGQGKASLLIEFGDPP